MPELKEVAIQLELKYGEAFAEAARTNACECVNARVLHKLGVAPPSAYLVVKYLSAIAKEHNVDWTEPDLGVEADDMADLDRYGLVLRNRRVREHGETTEMTRSHVDLR